MWEFIKWMRDRVTDVSVVLDKFSFDFVGVDVSILEIFIGFIALGLIISVFWKGART